MGFLEIVLIAIGLAMDAFAVSLSAGARKDIQNKRAVFRLSFHFGLFQFLMPIVGWYAGSTIVSFISSFAHWIAFSLLAYVGIGMIREGLNKKEKTVRANPSKGFNLIFLSVATSVDALAVGLSLAMIRVDVWYPSVVIGVITALLSLVGIRLGNRLGKSFGKRMEVAGGILLILIGLRILIPALMAV